MNLYLLTPKAWKTESLYTSEHRQEIPDYYHKYDGIFIEMIVAAVNEDEAKLVKPASKLSEDTWPPVEFIEAKLIGENAPYESGAILMSDYVEEKEYGSY